MDNETKKDGFLRVAALRFAGAQVRQVSALIAFYLLLALFPMAIALGNLLPYLGLNAETVMSYARIVLPEAVQGLLEPILHDLLTSSHRGLLSVSALMSIWSASRAVNHLQKGVNMAYGLAGNGSFIVRRLVSVVTIFLLIALLGAFSLVFSLGDWLLGALETLMPWTGGAMRQFFALKWPAALGVGFAMLLLLYRVTPDVKLRLRDVWPGALLATAGLVGLVQGFAYWLRFSVAGVWGYGALATFIVLMLWLNWSAMIVILGAVLNALVAEMRYGAAQEKVDRVELAVERTWQRLGSSVRIFWAGHRKDSENVPAAEGTKKDAEQRTEHENTIK